MLDYWPDGLELGDTDSPLEILKLAKEDWEARSDGQLSLIVQESESTNGHAYLEVHAKYIPTNQTISLFSVLHRHDSYYPSRIQPRDEELPDFFRKKYKRTTGVGLASMMATAATVTEKEVTNEWVCETPAEFRVNLRRALNLGVVKSEIVSLVSRKKSEQDISENDRESQSTQGES